MPGPPPKDPSVRQRRNKKAESAELEAPVNVRTPALPNPDKRTWHPLTRSWWKHLWSSPMSTRYLTTDCDSLGFMAILVDDFYKATNSDARQKLAAEIRQWGSRFGHSNWDRNRMNWTVTETARTKPRPQSAKTTSTETADPRKVLKVVK